MSGLFLEHLAALPPYSPELNPVEAIGDVIKDRIGNVLWKTLADLERAIGEELRPLYENAECVRRPVSHPWLVEQVNATAIENSAITCSKWYNDRTVICRSAGVHLHKVSWQRLNFSKPQNQIKTRHEN